MVALAKRKKDLQLERDKEETITEDRKRAIDEELKSIEEEKGNVISDAKNVGEAYEKDILKAAGAPVDTAPSRFNLVEPTVDEVLRAFDNGVL